MKRPESVRREPRTDRRDAAGRELFQFRFNKNAGGPGAPTGAGIHPQSPGTVATVAWLGTHGAPRASDSDLSTLDCPASLFGSVALGERSAGYSTLTSRSGEPISAGAQFAGLGATLLRAKSTVATW